MKILLQLLVRMTPVYLRICKKILMSARKPIPFTLLLIFSSTIYSGESTPNDDLFTIKTVTGMDESGHFNLQYPVLTSSFKSKNRQKINGILKKEFLDDKFCTKDSEKQTVMQSLSSIRIKYVSQQILSVVTRYDTYCGGPYPEQGEMYSTYNLSSGVNIDLLSQVKDTGKFKSFLAKQFQNHIPQKIPRDCRYLYSTEELLQVTAQFILTAGELVIKADYIHAAKSCEFDIAIKRCNMNEFLKSDSVLFASCLKS